MMMVPVFILLKIAVNKSVYFKIREIDKVLLLWIIYVIGNGFLHDLSVSLLLLEFCGLCILYLALRQISNKNIIWLYAALIIGGGIQAVYGNLQLWGYYPSHHSLFKITGSFFNPGPYGGYLSTVLTVTFGFYLFKIGFGSEILKTNRQKPEQIKIIMFPLMAFVALALVATYSRAAFLAFLISFVYLINERYKYRLNMLLKRSMTKNISIVTAVFILTGCLLTSLYYLKKDSANGRLLIWDISLNMIKEKPIFGYGFDRFKANYMNYQASFFAKNPNADEAMVAGDTNYAFNEPLQLTVENGLVGLLIIIIILATVFSSGKKVSPTERQHLVCRPDLDISTDKNYIVVIAKAGIISIIIFSLFSYPGQILPIKTSLVLYLATVANHPLQNNLYFQLSHYKLIPYTRHYVKLILIFAFLLLACAGSILLHKQVLAFKYWESANQYYKFGAYDACLQDFEKAYPLLKTNGDFLTNYGKALSEAEKPNNAIAILKQAEKSYPNTIVYTAIGNSYKALNLYTKAEQAYLYAWYMNPSRFYPKYLLVRLYNENGQKEKAVNVANELLHKRIKVESEAIREIKAEMNEIVKKDKVE